MDRFYGDADSLFVQAYDAFHEIAPSQIAGDVAFYSDVARATGGAVLELGCGTGRITLALAAAGFDITGLDVSDGMLALARRKAAALPEGPRQRLTFVGQDMSALELGRRFSFVFVPFRSFQHLLTSDLQKQTLFAIHRHLEPGGRLALHLFDPRLDMLIDQGTPPPRQSGTHRPTGRRYVGEIVRTRFDHLAQTRHDLWRYAEIGADGEILREDKREMVLRWTYRWELHHLLSLSRFAVDVEYSDFARSPPAYGKELIIVARAA